MRLHCPSFHCHLANLQAALATQPTDDARTALSVQHGDGLAQILSYLQPTRFNANAIVAVSPQARLDAETLRALDDRGYGDTAVQVHCRTLVHVSAVHFTVTTYRLRTLATWWMRRCAHRDEETSLTPAHPRHLPSFPCHAGLRFCGLRAIELNPHDLDYLLAAEGRERLHSLEVSLLRGVTCYHTWSSRLCWQNCGGVLCSLQRFPSLQRLHVLVDVGPAVRWLREHNVTVGEDESEPVGQLFAVAAATRVAELVVAVSEQGEAGRFHGHELTNMKLLQTLRLTRCSPGSFAGLSGCAALTELHIINAGRCVCDFKHFAAAPLLRRLVIRQSHITNFHDVAACYDLTHLELTDVSGFTTLDDVEDAPWLRHVVVERCNLVHASGLMNEFSSLTTLSLSRNPMLRWLPHFWGAADTLTHLNAVGCDLTDLSGLAKCLQLRELDVSHNWNLYAFDPVRELVNLRRFSAEHCNVLSLQWLNQLHKLHEIKVDGNVHLQTLYGVEDLSELRLLRASRCGLRSLCDLTGCAALRVLNVSMNAALTSLDDASGAPCLRQLIASQCDVRSLRGLGHCPRLTELDVSMNPHLRTVELQPSLPQLSTVAVMGCALEIFVRL